MKHRTMARFHRDETPHTRWCARDHRCGLNVHRSAGIIADHLGARAVITRVRADGIEYAEITARIPLAGHETTARRQLGLALHLIRRLIGAVAAVRPEPLPGPNPRPALNRRNAA